MDIAWDLLPLELVAVFVDRKTFADDTMVIALRDTVHGEKVPSVFVQTGTENARVLTPFLRALLDRSLELTQGLLARVSPLTKAMNGVAKTLADRTHHPERSRLMVHSPSHFKFQLYLEHPLEIFAKLDAAANTHPDLAK